MTDLLLLITGILNVYMYLIVTQIWVPLIYKIKRVKYQSFSKLFLKNLCSISMFRLIVTRLYFYTSYFVFVFVSLSYYKLRTKYHIVFTVTSYSPFQSLIFHKYIYVVLCLINSKLYRIQLLSTSKLTWNFLKCIMIFFVLENVVKYGILYPYFTDACHPSHPGNPFEILVILNVF